MMSVPVSGLQNSDSMYEKNIKPYFKRLYQKSNKEEDEEILEDFLQNQDSIDVETLDVEDMTEYSKKSIWELEFAYPDKNEVHDDYRSESVLPTKFFLKNLFHQKYLAIEITNPKKAKDQPDKIKLCLYNDKFGGKNESSFNCAFDIEILHRETDQDLKNSIFLKLKKNLWVKGNKIYLPKDKPEDAVLKTFSLNFDNSMDFDQNLKMDSESSSKRSYKDVMRMIQVDKKEVWEIKFLTSFKDALSVMSNDQSDTLAIDKLLNILKQINKYLKNKLVGFIDYQIAINKVSSQRQNILRTLNFPKVQMQLLQTLKQ